MSRRKTLSDFLRSTPVLFRAPVQWGEMDKFSHVNNVVYFKYLEGARLVYLSKLMNTVRRIDHEGGAAFAEGWNSGSGVGPILSDTQLAFKFPLTYPDRVIVGATVDPATCDNSVGSRITIHHDVWSLRHNRVVASGLGRVIPYDYVTNKVVAASDVLLSAIADIQANENCLQLLNELETERQTCLENEDL